MKYSDISFKKKKEKKEKKAREGIMVSYGYITVIYRSKLSRFLKVNAW
jgi:hypothetical protein